MSNAIAEHSGKKSLLTKFAHAYGVEPNKMLNTLTSTAFHQKNGQQITNEQMMALLVVADQYKLNPFTKEIYAFPDKNAGIVPIVGVDGWARIINQDANFDGMEFNMPDSDGLPPWIECTIYRKDRSHPTTVREYLEEVKRNTAPWGSHPRRMLRHKAMIQCARVAFGFVGIFDQDEGERIVGSGSVSRDERPAQGRVVADDGCITNTQANQINSIAYDAGIDLAPILEQLGVPDVAAIPATRFSAVLQRLNAEKQRASAPQERTVYNDSEREEHTEFFAEYDNAETMEQDDEH